jgi:translocator protein
MTREPNLATPRTRTRGRLLLGLAVIGGLTVAAALVGHVVTKRSTKAWYRTLKKPSWTPPDVAFGLVWPVLYTLSVLSAYRIWRSPPSRERSLALGLWGAQIATNAAWFPLFFKKKKPKAALVDLEANLGSTTAYALAAGKIDKTAGLLMAPYLAWVTYAGTIDKSVARHNSHGLFARLKIAS